MVSYVWVTRLLLLLALITEHRLKGPATLWKMCVLSRYYNYIRHVNAETHDAILVVDTIMMVT